MKQDTKKMLLISLSFLLWTISENIPLGNNPIIMLVYGILNLILYFAGAYVILHFFDLKKKYKNGTN